MSLGVVWNEREGLMVETIFTDTAAPCDKSEMTDQLVQHESTAVVTIHVVVSCVTISPGRLNLTLKPNPNPKSQPQPQL